MTIQDPIYVRLAPEDIKEISVQVAQLIKDAILEKQESEEFLTIEQAAEFLNMSQATLYRMSSKRMVPSYCPAGKRVLFLKSELIQWIKKSRRMSEEEIRAEAATYLAFGGPGRKRKAKRG